MQTNISIQVFNIKQSNTKEYAWHKGVTQQAVHPKTKQPTRTSSLWADYKCQSLGSSVYGVE